MSNIATTTNSTESLLMSCSPSDSNVVHSGVQPDPTTGSMLTPCYISTAFQQISVERYQELGYTYSRSANPTVTALENKIGEMEGATMPAVAFSTGMAAVNALICSFLKSGDHLVVTRCSYGGTNRALRTLYNNQFGINTTFVNFTDLQAIEDAIIPGKTKMIISETPCNPVLELNDLQAISDLAKKHSLSSDIDKEEEVLEEGAGPSKKCLAGRILHVADTTLGPPVMQRGLNFGVDVLLISLTKYYCGHNMHLGGGLVTNDKGLYDLMKFKQNVMGSIISPFTAFSILQSAKTMHLRVKKQSENAMKIAQWLEKHPKVSWVRYPGLESHPQHDIALKQHNGDMHGGMIALDIKGGSEAGRKVMNACCYPWTLAENLGAVESIMTCPSVFTHANMTRQQREAAGITDGMIRLSVGIEDATELIAALDKALAQA